MEKGKTLLFKQGTVGRVRAEENREPSIPPFFVYTNPAYASLSSSLLFHHDMEEKFPPQPLSLMSRAKLNGPKKVRFPSYVSPAIQRYSTPPVPVSVAVGVSVGVMRRDGSAARLPFRRFSRQSTGQKRQRGFSQKGQKSEVLSGARHVDILGLPEPR